MMKKILAFSFLLLQILFGQTNNGLFITEVMFNPLEPNGEFVELFNSSDSAIVLSGFFVKYSTNKADKIIPVNSKAILPPQHYAVIFENDYNFANGVYMEKVSDTTLVLQIDNGKFGSYGMANSTDREILLLSETGDTVDAYVYSANNKRGYSDEKICPDCSNDSENWSNSKILHGTPGGINSVSPRNYDLFASALKVYPKEIFVEDKIKVSFKIINGGKKNVDNYRIRIFLDINQDSLVQEGEILLDTLFTFIKSGDSLNVFGSKIINRSGSFILFAEVIFSEDELPENNIISKEIFVRKKKNMPNDIIINEIMYQPEGNEPEWVELFNRTDEKINLKNWRFADKTSKPVIADSTFFIDSKDYLVLTDDPELLSYHKILSPVKIFNLPSLNNKTDNLKLYDSLGQVIDSLTYNSSWGGGNGYSLERVSTEESGNDSTNWKTSCSKYFSTPGKINSATLKNNDLEISGIKLLQPYAVTGIPFQIEFTVFNRGREDAANFSVKIYRDINLDGITQAEELQRNINVSGLSAGDSVHYTETVSNFGKGQNEYIFTVVFPDDEFTENNQNGISFTGVEINEVRNDLVINEIMYAPNKPEPEWIEIYNRSDKKIDLKNYQIADATDTLKVMEMETVLLPDNYFVFADDSSFIDVYPDCKNFIVAKLPNLNNSGDRIILLDSLNRTIDSLLYSAKWGGTKGVSLERISSEALSTDSLNWKSAQIDSGGTPAKVNSVSQKEFDIAVEDILFFPAVPIQKENVSISVKIKNTGKREISFNLYLFEKKGEGLALLETADDLMLSPQDSLIHMFNYVIKKINREYNFLVKAFAKNEQDTSDNQSSGSITPSFTPLSLAINEIMYSPVNGEPEWVELLNISDDSINVKGITISDIFTTPKETVIDSALFIASGGYLVIAKDSTISDYHPSIGSKILILNFANLNNDVDGIVIRDFYGETIDSVMYRRSWGGMNGHSLERVLTANPSGDSSNWKSSIDLELSTPGKKNSVTPFNNDLQIAEISSVPEFPRLGEEIGIKTKIKNIGLQKALIYTVIVRAMAKNGTRILGETELHNLASNDSIVYITKEKFRLEDSVTVEAEINYEKDNNTTNNNTKITIYPGAKRKTFLITEFMANPGKGEAEWIEFYNASTEPIDISGWFVGDLFPVSAKCKVAEIPVIIEPDEYFVITNDSSKFPYKNVNALQVKFGTLGNNEDGIVIYDFNGNVVDSLKYDYHDWQIRKGRSLERVSFSGSSSDAENWLPSLALAGGTPGKQNSVSYTTPAANNSVLINEIMFDPDANNSEFVEFCNCSDTPIDIGGWELIVNNNKFFEVSPTFYTLEKNEYFVLASDSAILNNYNFPDRSKIRIVDKNLSLPNSSGTLVITDHWGNRIDSLVYNSDWHNRNIAVTKNKSLERISLNVPSNEEENWSTSVNNNGATPCSVNSVFAENKVVATGITFSPNPFSPDNDGFEDFSVINYSLPFVTAQIRIKIFDDHGRLVRTLINNQAVASKGSVVFNGLDDSGNALRIGMYIVFMEAVDEHSGKSVCYKDVIVIARKL